MPCPTRTKIITSWAQYDNDVETIASSCFWMAMISLPSHNQCLKSIYTLDKRWLLKQFWLIFSTLPLWPSKNKPNGGIQFGLKIVLTKIVWKLMIQRSQIQSLEYWTFGSSFIQQKTFFCCDCNSLSTEPFFEGMTV